MPATVTPVSGSLGNKETATLTAYTVTPAGGTTITQIVERVNGAVTNTFNNPASLSRSFVVPTATWDTLAYFSAHTVTVTVTDSTNATTVVTYTFTKTLSNSASLLEATKANNDARTRISTKRDALAAQVGLSAGATFDAISAQLASGVFYKVATGSASSVNTVTVTGLSFTPKLVIVEAVGNPNFGRSVYWGNNSNYDDPIYQYGGLVGSPRAWTVTSSGFSKLMNSVGNYKWIALG